MPGIRLCVLLSGLVLISCHQNHLQLEAINEGLETSARVLKANCDTSMLALIHGSRYETDQYWAVRWQPIVVKATLLAGQTADYIDGLQKELKYTHKLEDEQMRILFDTLLHYKQSLPRLFNSLQMQERRGALEADLRGVYASLAVLPGYPLSATPGSVFSRWKDSTFDDDEMVTRLALTKLKHDLILSAYQLIQFAREKIAVYHDLYFTMFGAIASISSSLVKPGDSIQVYAGVGRFTNEVNPIITIDNNRINLTADAVATKTIKAPHNPGKYAIPVRLEYTKPDGSTARQDYTLHYQVVAPCAP